MDEDQEFWAVIYTESHPDKEQTFIGVFSSEEKAEEVMRDHMSREKARLPRASIGEWNYHFHQTYLDHQCA